MIFHQQVILIIPTGFIVKVSCNTFLLLFVKAHSKLCQKSKKECCKNCERVINSFNYFRKTFHCRYLTGTWIRQGSAQLLEYSHTVYIRKNLFFKLPYLHQKLETVGEVKLSFSTKDSTWVACLHFVLSRICRMLNNKYLLKFVCFNEAFLARSSRPEIFRKKGVLKNFAEFTGKHLCQSLFFNKVAGLSLT